MKQVDKVIRKGDYYEMEVIDDGLFSIKSYKKEESISHMQGNSDVISINLPEFKEARAKYYYEPISAYSHADPDRLLHELEEILISEKLADEDKQQILKLIREVKILKEEPLVPLVSLTPSRKIKEKQPQTVGEVQLKIKLDISDLQAKVQELEKFTYPELNAFEHQLQVLLGEKKVGSQSQLPKDDRNKEEIDQLFAMLTNLSCASNISGLVDRIQANNFKYQQMANWTQQLQSTTTFHSDFLAELREDELLLNKLQENFKKNIQVLKEKVERAKEESKK